MSKNLHTCLQCKCTATSNMRIQICDGLRKVMWWAPQNGVTNLYFTSEMMCWCDELLCLVWWTSENVWRSTNILYLASLGPLCFLIGSSLGSRNLRRQRNSIKLEVWSQLVINEVKAAVLRLKAGFTTRIHVTQTQNGGKTNVLALCGPPNFDFGAFQDWSLSFFEQEQSKSWLLLQKLNVIRNANFSVFVCIFLLRLFQLFCFIFFNHDFYFSTSISKMEKIFLLILFFSVTKFYWKSIYHYNVKPFFDLWILRQLQKLKIKIDDGQWT